jgi:hypothetical protein
MQLGLCAFLIWPRFLEQGSQNCNVALFGSLKEWIQGFGYSAVILSVELTELKGPDASAEIE